jgi:hypothetical protein
MNGANKKKAETRICLGQKKIGECVFKVIKARVGFVWRKNDKNSDFFRLTDRLTVRLVNLRNQDGKFGAGD